MRLIEIKVLPTGAHNSHRIITGNISVPDGWAVIPGDMECENFPFGEVEVAEIDGVMTVTKWTPGVMPEHDPEPEPEPVEETSVWDELDAAYQEGVDAV